ncbi:MAG: hypothetical protein CVU90_13980 [Firmicutes bacterium HGW-Firmicutes-15]|nr:MAG: hypothetical protein CVU90_13980 [Firmicutes bacterium HGW-Firmicutes-15]
MDNYITSTLKLGRKVSMVLWLIDQYSSLGCNEEMTVYLNGRPAAFQRKAGGYLVFTDLEEDLYLVTIESQYYFKEELQVILSKLDRSEPIVYVPLKPAPTYRFNTGATLIRASLCTVTGEPVCTSLTATLCSDNCARAQLGSQGAKAGASEISLADMTGRIAPGDLLLIRPRDVKSGEVCEVTTMGAVEGIYSLKQPLLSDHNQGDLLMPLTTTWSDIRGEAVIGIRNLRQKECQVQVEISSGKHSQIVETSVRTGLINYLGKIVL